MVQTLDVRRTWVGELPPSITNLRKLQFLRTEAYGVLPRGIGKLKALSTLATVYVHENRKGTIKEFTQLYQVRKLGVENIRETNNMEFWYAIAGLNHLRSMLVNWYSAGTHDMLDSCLGGILLPPRSIESLKLGGPAVRLKEWIHQLQNLSKLHL